MRLFGTDGIRAKAGEFPLDETTVYCFGRSLADRFAAVLGREPSFITGRDTRESGYWIEQALHRGLRAAGSESSSAGVITTPGVAFVTRAGKFDAGIVVSASHNPYADNGLKVFLPSGRKMGEDLERSVEADIAKGCPEPDATSVDLGDASDHHQVYLEHLCSVARNVDANGMRLVLDCANGAASSFAPTVFASTKAEVSAINVEPNGRNINENCGSLHLEGLREQVLKSHADLGIAFDGDADRALFVDEAGEVVDGDAAMFLLARHMLSNSALKNKKVVATVMSNIGLEKAFARDGIEMIRADVGDKYVLESLLATESELGGEQSGHIIFPKRSLVGDGMMTGLLLIKALAESKLTLSQAVSGFERFPQVLVNVPVASKPEMLSIPAIADAAAQIDRALDGNGRLLLRYSGTENLARVMIEGPELRYIKELADGLAGVIQDEIG